jgi:3',5'-cyclic AMP phosphodiesterase CpdA
VATPIPTEKTWALDLEAGRPYTVSIEPPDAAVEAPFRFVIYADVQDHIDDVQDIYRSMAVQPGVRFGLISGDLTETGTPDQLRRFQREMRTLPFPCFATPGNHDLGDGDHLFQRYYGRASFSFPFHGARFTLVDSASATVAPRVYGWLDDWMQLADGRLHLAMMHIPPLDPSGLRNGAFASRAEGMKLVSRMARGGVDLTVYGHVHSYYTFRNAGVDAIITGGGGAIPERLDGIGRHYLLMDADPVEQRFRSSVVRVHPED